MQKLNTEISSRINRSLVLSLIHQNPLISRAQISVRTGLDRSTITHILNYLLREKLVKEVEKGKAGSRGGRCPIPLTVLYDARNMMALEVGTERCEAVLTNMRGDEIRRWHREIRRGEPLLELLDGMLTQISEAAPKPFRNVLVVGISIPGIVDAEKGIVRHCGYHDWRDVEVAAPLREKFGKFFFVENDANAAAVGELSQCNEQEKRCLLYMLIREAPPEAEQILGVGGALIFNGNLWHGSNYFAGEVAHTVNALFRSGAIEAWRKKISRAGHPERKTLGYLLEYAAKGEQAAVAAAEEMSMNIGKFLAELVSFMDPANIMMYINPDCDGFDVNARIKESFFKNISSVFWGTNFLPPKLHDKAIIQGLLALGRERIFIRSGMFCSLLFQ